MCTYVRTSCKQLSSKVFILHENGTYRQMYGKRDLRITTVNMKTRCPGALLRVIY